MKISFILLLLISFVAKISAQIDNAIHNPKEFCDLFISDMKQQDSLAFLSHYCLTEESLNVFLDQMVGVKYSSRKNYNEYVERLRTEIPEISKDSYKTVSNLYSVLNEWSVLDTIDFDKITFETVFFELENKPRAPFNQFDDLDLIISYNGTRLYRFEFDDITYINGAWAILKLPNITVVDDFIDTKRQVFDRYDGFPEIKSEEAEEATEAIEMEEYADEVAVAAVEEEISTTVDAPDYVDLSKKQMKKKKKADKYWRKYVKYEELIYK